MGGTNSISDPKFMLCLSSFTFCLSTASRDPCPTSSRAPNGSHLSKTT
uniref:Uncharacterized protein n=1 Tax=Phakopsora pachyrhizi TaxID=170000 RepID=A0A0S1MJW3_PHAPC